MNVSALDHYVTLGGSGLRVSPLCLGTMTFGEDWSWGTEPEGSKEILAAYLDRGGNFIDTANIYTKGHSEVVIGEYLKVNPEHRRRAVIATKFGGGMYPGDPNGGGTHRRAVFDAVEHSLRRLQMDHVDLLWCHFQDPHTPIVETLGAMNDLVRQGKVRYIGLSDHPAWVCAQAQYECRLNHFAPIVALQIEHSLAERTVEAELMPMARELGMGVTPWSPLKGGILTGKYTRENVKQDEGRGAAWEREITEKHWEILDALHAVADETGKPVAQVALRWVVDRAGVSSTIIGARTMSQLESNLGCLDVSLSDEQTARLDEASKVPMAFPFDFLGRAKTTIQNGSRVNDVETERWPLSPDGDGDRW
ncbi:MAG: aldo/keto reductase [Planctomycetota bacterium]